MLTSLRRLLDPATVAVVGANESLAMSNNAIRPMLEAGVDVRMVNPRRERVYDRPCLPSLADLDGPVDAVLSLVNAERSVATLREAAALGCGGLVVAAAGFAEAGESGLRLQSELAAIARSTDTAVVGPNCSGYINARSRVNMFTGGAISPRPGGLAIVSQSGFLVRSALAAAGRRQLGVSIAISSGNEAVCDLADYIEFFAVDETTSVICLVVEKVRDPDRFFAAVRRAREHDTAVIALKLGRTETARSIITSHTGAIADAAWVYDVAFREHGVLSASDLDDMLDKVQLFEQLPRQAWKPMRRAALITSSGGVSALATDLATGGDVTLPPMPDVADWVHETIPGAETVNPLDMTGFVVTDPEVLAELFTRYAGADGIDLLGLCWWVGDGDAAWGKVLLEPFAAAAAAASTPLAVTSLEATAVGAWTDGWKERGLAVTAGVSSLYRAMAAMTEFVTYRAAPEAAPIPPSAATATSPLGDTEPGQPVTFDLAMRLLTEVGIATAPYVIVDAGEDPAAVDTSPLGDRLVVKLADVPHRTELGAVTTDVSPNRVADAVRRMREIAAGADVAATVVIQPQITGIGEAFIGLQLGTDLGSLVVLGRGGILVETSGELAGRLLPLSRTAAESLVATVAGDEVVTANRGQQPWPVEALVEAALAADRLAQRLRGHAWSVDLNPLIVSPTGVTAVDALILAGRRNI
jgi:acyl-CoA synthetase (NDP forming)